MKIPRKIENALDRRVKAAETLAEMDRIITNFIVDNDIEIADEDYLSGYEIYTNPQASADRIRKAIMAKERVQK